MKRRSLSFFAVAVAVGFAANCGGPFADIDRSKLSPTAEEKNAPGLVLLDETVLEYHLENGEPHARLHHHQQIEILSEAGAELADVRVPYQRGIVPIVDFLARGISPSGEQRQFSRGEANDLPAYASWELYADQRMLEVRTPFSTPGSIVEHTVDLDFPATPFFSHRVAFQAGLPIRQIVFVVQAPPGWKISYRAEKGSELEEFTPFEMGLSGLHHWRWQRNDLPALPARAHAPSLPLGVSVALAEYTDASGRHTQPVDGAGVAAWERNAVQTPADAALLRPIVAEQTRPDMSERERAAHLYAWVRDQISYCAIEIGLGVVPHTPSEVLAHRYGDCKDKARLLQALLEQAGIDSDLVIVGATAGWEPLRALPSSNTFNHAITRVHLQDGDVFADPTSRVAAFGELPSVDTGAVMLTLAKAGALPERGPDPAAEKNTFTRALTLKSSGEDLVGELHLVAEGVRSETMRELFLPGDDQNRNRQLAKMLGRGGRLTEAKAQGAEPHLFPAPVSVEAKVVMPGGWSGKNAHIIRWSDLLSSPLSRLAKRDADAPVLLPRKEKLSDRVRLALAGGKCTPPAPRTIAGPRGVSCQLRAHTENDTLVIERDCLFPERFYPQADAKAFVAFSGELADAEAQPLVVENP